MKETFEDYLQRLKDRRTEDDYKYTDEDFKKYIHYIFDCYEKGMSVYKCLEFMYFAERDMDDQLFNREPKQEKLEETTEINLTRLCYYDKRNPDFQIKEEYGYDKEEVEATGNFSKKDCACDNCFYGRSKLTEQLIWQQERMYSEEDMIEFAFNTYHYISELMGVSFNLMSENKLHAMYNFEQFKKK
jgi:hypothetical protein